MVPYNDLIIVVSFVHFNKLRFTLCNMSIWSFHYSFKLAKQEQINLMFWLLADSTSYNDFFFSNRTLIRLISKIYMIKLIRLLINIFIKIYILLSPSLAWSKLENLDKIKAEYNIRFYTVKIHVGFPFILLRSENFFSKLFQQ